MKLRAYIDKHHGGVQIDFADEWGYTKQQVWKWIQDDWYVIDDWLMSPKRKLGDD